MLELGDGVYPSGTYANYTSKFFNVYGSLFQPQNAPLPAPTTAQPKPLYPAPGNHDYDDGLDASGYRDSFVLPANGPAGVPSERFYTFDVNGIHFVSLDIEGAELEALTAFPFETTRVGAWAIEHNLEEPKRTRIAELLRRHGYVRVHTYKQDDFYAPAPTVR